MVKIVKHKRRRIIKAEYKPSLGERVEDFLHSDTASATATKILLATAGLGILVFGGAVIPGILKALKGFEFSSVESKNGELAKKDAQNALSNLKRQKLIKIVKEKDGKFKIKLTNKGKKRFLKLSLESVSISNPEKWDGKWRIVIFDIPNDSNPARVALRRKMKEMGLKQLQKSVWVHPYECEDEILFVAEVFEVEEYVEIITAEKVLHEKILRQAFNV